MKNTSKYVYRIIALPPMFVIFLITALKHLFLLTWSFIKYGGEFIEYSDKITPDTIKDVYYEVAKLNEHNIKKK